MIKRIHVSGYRSVRDLERELRPINVLTGRTGSENSTKSRVWRTLGCQSCAFKKKWVHEYSTKVPDLSRFQSGPSTGEAGAVDSRLRSEVPQ